ncbi:hypothetical protein MAPG_08083 [Magnaporthiopsis poae ATCC 64411]|uniref:Uncharacterized protein n=1 Tax=Magnaporthiopsis poae (strain ATCC 64411 / 73-15) TaxID=644358 RepID=A0A0C4E6E9_MAGP6|nr:hypothetical protein MAPG_08083 [Magnaporthiopsis poae ATCC 64411]
MAFKDLTGRLAVFKDILSEETPALANAFALRLESANGDIDRALADWSEPSASSDAPSPGRSLLRPEKLRLFNRLAGIFGDDVDVLKGVHSACPEATSTRDVALGLGKNDFSRLARSESRRGVAATSASAASAASARTASLRQKIFRGEPTATIQRMLADDEIALSRETHLPVQKILDEDATFNICTTPVSSLLRDSHAFKHLSDEMKPAVESSLKTLQRVQALSPSPDALAALTKQGVTSAHQISNMPMEHFVAGLEKTLGSRELATSIHQHAVASRIRNEGFLVSALQTVRSSGLRVIDGGATKLGVERRSLAFNQAADGAKTQVNLEKLFGSLDYCECSDCTSVYSPASYYVELLEFLRHNNLKPDNPHLGNPTSVKGTQLEQLLRRRPDLACLELTCENTNTLIPYIDLALDLFSTSRPENATGVVDDANSLHRKIFDDDEFGDHGTKDDVSLITQFRPKFCQLI